MSDDTADLSNPFADLLSEYNGELDNTERSVENGPASAPPKGEDSAKADTRPVDGEPTAGEVDGDEREPEVELPPYDPQAFEKGLAERLEISDELAEQLMSDPKGALKAFGAQVQRAALESAVTIVRQLVPKLMGEDDVRSQIVGTVAQQQESERQEKQFYDRWPDLKAPEAKPVLAALGQAYLQQNPKASWDQVVEEVGAMASRALGKGKRRDVPPPPARGGAAPAAPERSPAVEETLGNDFEAILRYSQTH